MEHDLVHLVSLKKICLVYMNAQVLEFIFLTWKYFFSSLCSLIILLWREKNFSRCCTYAVSYLKQNMSAQHHCWNSMITNPGKYSQIFSHWSTEWSVIYLYHSRAHCSFPICGLIGSALYLQVDNKQTLLRGQTLLSWKLRNYLDSRLSTSKCRSWRGYELFLVAASTKAICISPWADNQHRILKLTRRPLGTYWNSDFS